MIKKKVKNKKKKFKPVKKTVKKKFKPVKKTVKKKLNLKKIKILARKN